MTPKTYAIITSAFFIATRTTAFATEQDPGPTHTLIGTILTFLPVLLVLGIVFFFFRAQINSPRAKLSQRSIERHIEHMERVEALLERLTSAIERNNKP